MVTFSGSKHVTGTVICLREVCCMQSQNSFFEGRIFYIMGQTSCFSVTSFCHMLLPHETSSSDLVTQVLIMHILKSALITKEAVLTTSVQYHSDSQISSHSPS